MWSGGRDKEGRRERRDKREKEATVLCCGLSHDHLHVVLSCVLPLLHYNFTSVVHTQNSKLPFNLVRTCTICNLTPPFCSLSSSQLTPQEPCQAARLWQLGGFGLVSVQEGSGDPLDLIGRTL